MTAISKNTKSGFEWLGEELKAKAISYEIAVKSTGKRGPTWDEKLGVFAKMDDDLQKDLAYLLAFGDYRDGTQQFKNVVQFLFKSIFAVASNEKKRKLDHVAKLSKAIARMELYYFLHPFLEEKFTGAGRIWFCGVDKLTTFNNYRLNWEHYSMACKMMLKESALDVELHIQNYREQLEKD